MTKKRDYFDGHIDAWDCILRAAYYNWSNNQPTRPPSSDGLFGVLLATGQRLEETAAQHSPMNYELEGLIVALSQLDNKGNALDALYVAGVVHVHGEDGYKSFYKSFWPAHLWLLMAQNSPSYEMRHAMYDVRGIDGKCYWTCDFMESIAGMLEDDYLSGKRGAPSDLKQLIVAQLDEHYVYTMPMKARDWLAQHTARVGKASN